MKQKLLLGPLLGLEGEDEAPGFTRYSVCFLTDGTASAPKLDAVCEDIKLTIDCVRVGNPEDGIFWRANLDLPLCDAFRICRYRIVDSGAATADPFGDGDEWSFYVPGARECARFAFASCNGFSSGKLARDTKKPYVMWKVLWDEQVRQIAAVSVPGGEAKRPEDAPLSLLVLGGDQVYADALFEGSVKEIRNWTEMSREEQAKHLSDADAGNSELTKLRQALDQFYSQLYRRYWTRSREMAQAMASIPTVMMWDDHDIFDGWGSHPDELQDSPVFKEVFAAAKKYFELFQIGGLGNRSLQARSGEHYGQTVVFRDFSLVVLDGRSRRRVNQILDERAKIDFREALKAVKANRSNRYGMRSLVVVAGIPLVYRRFSDSSLIRWMADSGDFLKSNYDDMLDQWNFRGHRSELCSIIATLLDFLNAEGTKGAAARVLVLSGDVHVACAGAIKEIDGTRRISQVVASGIVHPPPKSLEWGAICLASEDDPGELSLGDGRRVKLLLDNIPGASSTYIRERNFVRINHGTDGKLWANWRTQEQVRDDETLDPNAHQIALAC